MSDDFEPKRLREYRMAEVLKPEIQRQIDELLRNGFIRHSTSALASQLYQFLKVQMDKAAYVWRLIFVRLIHLLRMVR